MKYSRCLTGDNTLNKCIHSCSVITIRGQWKLRERGNLCDKEGIILYNASVTNPSDTIPNETSNWAKGEIQRTLCEVYFSVDKNWRCKLLSDSGMRTFS
jgi:hypothetical protein